MAQLKSVAPAQSKRNKQQPNNSNTMGMEKAPVSSGSELRQRKRNLAANTDTEGTTSTTGGSRKAELKRQQSWHAAAADHVLSRRRYSLLMGIILGVAGIIGMQFFYLDQSLPDMIAIPHESMKILREKFSFEWSQRVKEDLLASFDYKPSILTSSEERPGQILARDNITAHYPVVLIPGFSSTGLEIWAGRECAKAYFRQRIWGTARMLQQFMMNQKCWLEHVMLNRATGLDPDDIKLRPAQGLEAADYLIGGFWVWGKVVENLADIGYDSNTLHMAAYDWRLPPTLMEERDHYFTKLKFVIEMAKSTNHDRKVVLVSHSYATQVIYHFMKWVESDNGGKGGKQWVDNHIESLANIAGPTLGTAKSISALLSGEMKDTAALGGLSKFLGLFFGPPARALLARSWPSIYTMLPIGANTIWGEPGYAPDDVASKFPNPFEDNDSDSSNNAQHTWEEEQKTLNSHLLTHGANGRLVQFTDDSHSNVSAAELDDLFISVDKYLTAMRRWMHVDVVPKDQDLDSPEYDLPKYWTNPLASTLPNAPSMKLFCFYGVGKPVERGYVYRANNIEDDEIIGNERVVPYILNTNYNDPPWVQAGIRYSDGDGTVPLISLGYMCARGWRNSRFNPGNMEIRVREYVHDPVSILFDPRGGPKTADHVDIMGNHDMITDLLRIAAGRYDLLPERITSNIMDIADRVKLDL